jgi:hypothetical protein
LFKDIKTRTDEKQTQINDVLAGLIQYLSDKNDAMVFLPRIKELLEVGVHNNEQLVKLAGVAQKLITIKNGPTELLSEEDKEALLKSSLISLKDIEREISIPMK